MTKELLQKRKDMKKRKPTYVRAQSNQFPKLKNDSKWRRPKGMHNKNRKQQKGHVGMLQVGYGSPKAIKHTNSQGMYEVLVNRVEDLEKINTKTQVPLIAGGVGKRKRIAILEEAKKKKLSISNVKDVESTLSTLKASVVSKKKSTKKEEKKSEEKNSQKEESTETKKTSSKKEETSTESKKETSTKSSTKKTGDKQ